MRKWVVIGVDSVLKDHCVCVLFSVCLYDFVWLYILEYILYYIHFVIDKLFLYKQKKLKGMLLKEVVLFINTRSGV